MTAIENLGPRARGGWTFQRPVRSIRDRIRDGSVIDETTGCWVWSGALKNNGYASIVIGRRNDGTRRKVYAHRASYEAFLSPIGLGLVIDHLCRNRACVNPEHMEPVTTAENLRRGQGWSGENARKTHCVHGHEFTAENTIIEKLGRKCRTCTRERNRIAKKAKRAAQRSIAA